MRIAVFGAGAVGSYFGGMLARAGHEVVLVARPAHVEAVRRDDLLLDTLHFRERVRVLAHTDPEAAWGAELVLFCVKSIDTDAAGASLRPFLSRGACVLSLQNGVDNAERLQALLPQQRVIPTVVYVAAELEAPGHVRHRGRGQLVMPGDASCRSIAELLRASGVPVQTTSNMPGEQWAKLIVNCAFNALSAIPRLPFGALMQAEGVHEAMKDLVHECLAVAEAAGVQVVGDPLESLRKTGSQSGQYSSMAQDLMRGRRTEIEHLNGYVVRQGGARGVPTPANRLLVVLVKLLEQQQQQQRCDPSPPTPAPAG